VKKTLLSAAMVLLTGSSWALQVSPTYQQFMAKPGSKTQGQMTVTNNENEVVTLTPTVKEWFLLNENAQYTVDKWLKLDDEREFKLKPGESKVISYSMIAPKKAKGELAGAVTFSTKPKAQMITLQLSVVQYLGLTGTEKPAMKVEEFGVNITTNTEVAIVVKNEGNVHVRPAGYIYIDDPNGRRVLNVEIPVGQPAFPGATRLYSGTVKGFKLQPGRYTARIELSEVDRPIKYPAMTKKFSIDANGKVEVR
jgi:hypothetical protein